MHEVEQELFLEAWLYYQVFFSQSSDTEFDYQEFIANTEDAASTENFVAIFDALHGFQLVTENLDLAESLEGCGTTDVLAWFLTHQFVTETLGFVAYEGDTSSDIVTRLHAAVKAQDMLKRDPTGLCVIDDTVSQIEAIAQGKYIPDITVTIPEYMDPEYVLAGARLGQTIFTHLTNALEYPKSM